MRRNPIIEIVALLAAIPAAASAQDAQSIMREVRERQIQRFSGVNDYLLEVRTMGLPGILFFERVAGTDAFRLVPPPELAQRQSPVDISPGDIGEVMDMYGPQFAQMIESGLAEEGLPIGLLPLMGFDLREGISAAADFMNEAERETQAMREASFADAQNDLLALEQFASGARVVGRESVDGIAAFLLRADGLGISQQAEGAQFTLNTASLWIDTAQYVPLRMRFEGNAVADGESRDIVIEKYELDYRQVSGLYESHRQLARMSGMLSPAEEAQLAQAQAQLAELRQQLASMPAAQQQMIQNMMGPQMEQLEKMGSGGGIEIETVVCAIRVNQGVPTQQQMAEAMDPRAPCGR